MYVQIILTLLSDGGCMYIVLDTADKSLIMVTAGGGATDRYLSQNPYGFLLLIKY